MKAIATSGLLKQLYHKFLVVVIVEYTTVRLAYLLDCLSLHMLSQCNFPSFQIIQVDDHLYCHLMYQKLQSSLQSSNSLRYLELDYCPLFKDVFPVVNWEEETPSNLNHIESHLNFVKMDFQMVFRTSKFGDYG